MERVGRSEDFTRVAIARGLESADIRVREVGGWVVGWLVGWLVGGPWRARRSRLMLLRRKPENWDVVLNFLCTPKSTISAFGDVLEKKISRKL